MTLFGLELSSVEAHLLVNMKKTREAFHEETQTIEQGLALMFDLNQAIREVEKEDTRPELHANQSLFARNRQLLLDAYFCLLCASYGTQFVILRTVLENNNLMRLFNQDSRCAFEWLPKEKQRRFSTETKLKYEECEHDRTYEASWVRKQVFKENKKEIVWKNITELYGELCDYTHPNFRGWQELMAVQGGNEVLLDKPAFLVDNAYLATGITLYLMQSSFKTLVETFRSRLSCFAAQLRSWQGACNKLIIRYSG